MTVPAPRPTASAAAVTMSLGAWCSGEAPGFGVAHFERKAIAILAGRRAEARALKPDAEGWRKVLDRQTLTGLHESAHLVAAYKVGLVPYEARLMPGERRDGIACYGTTPVRPPQHESTEHDLAPDRHKLVRDYCPALALAWYGELTWQSIRACIRKLTAQTDELVAAHLLLIWNVANALLRRGRLDQKEIADLLNPPPRPGESRGTP
jgi:hypothetical protein